MLTVGRGLPNLVDEQIDLGEREASNLDIEFEVDEGLQFDRQYLTVPAGIQGELVVGNDIGPALSCIEVGQAKRRDAPHPQKLGSFDAAVARDDLIFIADQYRIV